jgi:hypothetical protein
MVVSVRGVWGLGCERKFLVRILCAGAMAGNLRLELTFHDRQVAYRTH